MRFVFEGTLNEVKNTIYKNASKLYWNVVIYQNEPNILQIGFLRTGHSGGRFFVADITEENGCVTLDGEIENVKINMPDPDTRSAFKKFRDTLFGLISFSLLMAIIPLIIWLLLDIPHPWIPLAISAVFVICVQVKASLRTKEQNFDTQDERFLRFMTMISNGETIIPENSQELYQMLMNTQGLRIYPEIKDDIIAWELYEDVFIKAYIDTYDTRIDIVNKNIIHGSYTHWHPDIAEIYEELVSLGKKGNILVLRKTFSGTEVYYIGNSEKYRFDKNKKWYWGKLIYLEQK